MLIHSRCFSKLAGKAREVAIASTACVNLIFDFFYPALNAWGLFHFLNSAK